MALRGFLLLPPLFALCMSVATNITIDDTDPSITYVGSWNHGTNEADSYGGGHASTTSGAAKATLVFNGTAIYYLSSLFSGYRPDVSTLLTLDSNPGEWIDLSAPTSTKYDIRWSKTGLTNGPHTLVISPGTSPSGQKATWGEVDGFIITQGDDDPSTTSTSTTSVPSLIGTGRPSELSNTDVRVLSQVSSVPSSTSGTIASTGASSITATTSSVLTSTASAVNDVRVLSQVSSVPSSTSGTIASTGASYTTTTSSILPSTASAVNLTSSSVLSPTTASPTPILIDAPVTRSASIFSWPPVPTPQNLDVDISGAIQYSGNWTTGDDVCGTGPTMFADSADDSFTVSFQGSQLFIKVVKFPGAGKLSLSINGGTAQVFDLNATEVTCGYISPQVPSPSRRTLAGRDSADAENQCTGKVVDPPVQLDGASYRRETNSNAGHARRSHEYLTILVVIVTTFLY